MISKIVPELEHIAVPVGELHEDPENIRVHDDRSVEAVAESFNEFGQRKPIVALDNGKVIAGNAGLVAARDLLGWSHVAVVRFRDDEEELALRYAIADNKTGDLSWFDGALLAETVRKLAASNAANTAGLGFSKDELKSMAVGLELSPDAGHGLGGTSGTEPEEEPTPAIPSNPVAKPGDIWELGRHRLMCGKAVNYEDVLQGEPARYGMFDPPYGIGVVKGAHIGVAKGFGTVGATGLVKPNKYIPVAGDDEPFDPKPILASAQDMIWWGANYYASELEPRKGWLAWDKKGRDDWNDNFSDCELAWTTFKITTRVYRFLWMGMVREGEREERVHPTQKPTGLFTKIIGDLFVEDGIIADWYLGSGTTLLACERLGRTCRAIELEPGYVDIAVERWQNATGEKARRLA